MLQFTSSFKNEVDANIEPIERSKGNMMMKPFDASHVLEEAFEQLKAF